ncbi:MAG: zinc ribbon domain-containing protein [Planctomycetota bacterium]
MTGLLRCGACGGSFIAVGRKYLASANARKLGSCSQRKGIRRQEIDAFVLDLLRERLMEPAAVEAFVSAYHREINRERDTVEAGRHTLEARRRKVSKQLDGLYVAIADGLRSPGLLAKLEGLEAEKATLDRDLAGPAPSPVRLHPDLAGAYRQNVEDLAKAIHDPETRDAALPLLRALIEAVTLTWDDDGWRVCLDGDICACRTRRCVEGPRDR